MNTHLLFVYTLITIYIELLYIILMNIHKPYILLYLYAFSLVRCLLSITMEFLLLHTIHIRTTIANRNICTCYSCYYQLLSTLAVTRYITDSINRYEYIKF